jgi:hypothetical protein
MLDLDTMGRNGKFPVGITDHADDTKGKDELFPFFICEILITLSDLPVENIKSGLYPAYKVVFIRSRSASLVPRPDAKQHVFHNTGRPSLPGKTADRETES